MMHDASYRLAEALGNRLKDLNLRLALAESCTGGGIASAVTDIPGSSHWFDRGFVTYSNPAKVDMLGVRQSTLDSVGAVSSETALEMAAGALAHSDAELVLAVTGIVGPDGGSGEKPVGTVFVAWQRRGEAGCWIRKLFAGNRQAVRRQVVEFSLQQLLELVGG